MKRSVRWMMWCGLLFSAAVYADRRPEVPLPALKANDLTGRAVSSDELRLNKKWALIVLDASLPSTLPILSELENEKVSFEGRTTILLIGTPDAAKALFDRYGKIEGVRWMRTQNASILKAMNLPGVPAVLGITADQKVAWRRSGAPRQRERVAKAVLGWSGIERPVAK